MNPHGRPPILSDADKQDKILEVIAKGGSPRMAARAAGVHLQTLERFLRDDPHFQPRFDLAQSDYECQRLDSMNEAAKAHWRANAWVLERADRHAFHLGHPAQFSLDDALSLFSSTFKNALIYINQPKAQQFFVSAVYCTLRVLGLADDPRFQQALRPDSWTHRTPHFDPASGDLPQLQTTQPPQATSNPQEPDPSQVPDSSD
jgi:hypothetical protein